MAGNSLRKSSVYMKEFLSTLMLKEKSMPVIHGKSPQLHCRKYVVEWLCSVCELLKLNTCTVHLALHILDCFMDAHNIEHPQQGLVTLGCIWVAAKFEEKEIHVPRASELNAIVSDRYEIASFPAVEAMILRHLQWNLAVPTPAIFCHFFNLAALPVDQSGFGLLAYKRLLETYRVTVAGYLDLTMREFAFTKMRPSKTAASCVAAARRSLNLHPVWTQHLETVTGYSFFELAPILDLHLCEPRSPNVDATVISLDCTPESGYASDSGSDKLSQSWTDESDSSLSSAMSIKRRQAALVTDHSKRRKK